MLLIEHSNLISHQKRYCDVNQFLMNSKLNTKLTVILKWLTWLSLLQIEIIRNEVPRGNLENFVLGQIKCQMKINKFNLKWSLIFAIFWRQNLQNFLKSLITNFKLWMILNESYFNEKEYFIFLRKWTELTFWMMNIFLCNTASCLIINK